MHDIFRDASLGQIVRWLSSSRLLKYPEELSGFELPAAYQTHLSQPTPPEGPPLDDRTASVPDSHSTASGYDLEKPEKDDEDDSHEQHDQLEMQRTTSTTRYFTVTWYSENDSENPYNWSGSKKIWTGFVIMLYTLSVYIAASLYTASIPHMMQMWNIGRIAASVGLSIYVVGYGLGPMIMTPLSEIPRVGRNAPYIISMFLFVIICIPIALVDNYAGMLVLRFLLGVAGSPALATGGASYGDFLSGMQLPYGLAIWAGGGSAGPTLGPMIANFAVQAKSWRWPFYETLWLAGPTFILMLFTLPETSSDLILLRRAERLRRLTGRTDLMAECELRQRKVKTKEILFSALIKPWEINIKDPAVLFTTIYTGLIYGIYYSSFESFPIVFGEIYNFGFGVMGLAYLSIAVGCGLAVAVWCGFFYFVADKQIAKMQLENVPPEKRLTPGLIATLFIPAGLFMFAWTSRKSIHWIVPMIGISWSFMGTFIIVQCIFIYLPFCYPRYTGSLFAANGLSRALLAAAAILFSTPMFDNLGVDWGVSLLAFLCCGCCFGIYILYFFGAKLRRRSKFADSN